MRRVRNIGFVRRIILGVMALVMPCGGYVSAVAADDPQSDEQRMAAGLRSRLLFDLADKYCDERLAKRDRSPVDQSNLLIEKIQTQMARAVQASSESRAEAWQVCRRLGDEFLAQNPQHPQRLLIRVQQALALLAEARLACQELAVSGAGPESREAALDRLRTARQEFESILRDLAKELPQAPAKRGDSGRLTSLQLQGLQSNLQFQVGMCHLMRAELVDPSKVADRLDALTTANKNFSAVLDQSDPEGSLWCMSQIRLAEINRLNGEQALARRILESLKSDEMPRAQQSEYWEQQLEIADSENGVLATLTKVALLANRPPELELASLRAILRVAAAAPASERDKWLNRAAQLTEEIETRHGSYWGRLAELTLIKSSGLGTPERAPVTSENPNMPGQMGSVEILIRTGDNAVREGRGDDALQAYRKAIQLGKSQATNDEGWKTVLQTQLKVSRLLESTKAFQVAAHELLACVNQRPRHELACWLHLQAIWCLAQGLENDAEIKAQYRNCLEQHLSDYESSPTLPFALLWKARLEAAEGNYRLATDLYLRVDPASDSGAAAMGELLSVIERHLDSLAQQPDRVMSEADSLVQALRARLATVTDNQFVAKAQSTQSLLAALATIGLRWGVLNGEELSSWLTGSLQVCAENDPWRDTAHGLLVASFATNTSHHGRAIEILDQLKTQESLGPCLALLNSISQRDRNVNPIRLEVINRLLTQEKVDSPRRIDWRLQQAAIWQESGQLPEAIAALSGLAREYSKRLDVQLQLARVLSLDTQKRDVALGQWRRVAAGVKDRSDEWFEAKYHVAKLLLESGQASEARKLLDYLSAFPPGWSASKLKLEFDELAKRAREANFP